MEKKGSANAHPYRLAIIAAVAAMLCACNRPQPMAAGSPPSREFVAETARPAAESPHRPGPKISEPAASPQGQFIARRRRKPLDVVLVIQRADAIEMRPVRAKLLQLADAIRHFVPNALVGVITYDGTEVRVLPLTNAGGPLKACLRGIAPRRASGHGSNTLPAIKIAVDGIRWQASGNRFVVWFTGSGPPTDSFDPLLALVERFHAGGGVFNVVDTASSPAGKPRAVMRLEKVRLRRAILERLAHAGGGQLRDLEGSGPNKLKRPPLAGERFAGQPTGTCFPSA